MKAQNSLNLAEEEQSFSKFIQKTQEETKRVHNLLESIENESTLKSAQSHFGIRSEISRSKVVDLDQEILSMRDRILIQKKQICQQRVDDQNALRKVKSLEQNLQNAQLKYNSALSRNKLIKDNIDTLRKDQKIFKDLCKTLADSINEAKAKMEELADVGSKTRKNREFAENQINELESQAAVEDKEYQKSIIDLKNLISKEKSMKNDIGSARLSASVSQDMKNLESEEEDVRKKIVRVSWKIAQDKANMIINLNKMEEYEIIIKKFQDLTGVSNYQSLLKHYQSTREHNQTLFKYVQGLTNELEQLENQLIDMKEKVRNFRVLEKNQKVDEKKSREFNNGENRQQDYDFNGLREKIDEAFVKLGCFEIKDAHNLNDREIIIAKIREIEKRVNEVVSLKGDSTWGQESRFKSSYKIEVEIPAFQDKEKDIEEDDGYLVWQDFGSKDPKKSKGKKK
jgi:hypothetical protein